MKTFANFLKKHKIKLIAAAVIAAVVAIIPFVFKPESQSQNYNNYAMDLSYNEQTHILSGVEEVEYFNSRQNAFSSIYFHLYPNAFRQGSNSPVVSSNNFDKAFPNGESYGWIDILKVSDQSAAPLNFSVGGEDQNILQIDLADELYPDESVKISIEFETILPNSNHRFGYGESVVNLGNFYPIACVYEDGKGFSTQAYHSNGDPFYSDISCYLVNFSCSSDFIVASSGEEKNRQTSGQTTTYSYQGDKIRDFCIVLSQKFEKASSQVGGTTINYYGYQGDQNLQAMADFASQCVSTYNEMFGTYPYSTLNVVKSNFVHGGMEYPGIVLISDGVSDEDFQYVIAHEIAHQWWYGVVGTNQYDHAWIDEGLAEYSTYLFFENNQEFGLNYSSMISNALTNYKFFVQIYQQINGEVDTSMDRPLDQFGTEPEYVQCVYTKGVLLFDSLRESVGERKFLKALKDLYKDFAYQNISPAELIASFSSSTGRNLENFIEGWIEGKVVIA